MTKVKCSVAVTVLAAAVFSQGCASLSKNPDIAMEQVRQRGLVAMQAARTPELFYGQQNAAPILEVTGTNLSFTMSVQNADRLCLSTPVSPKAMIPKDPTMTQTVVEELGKTARVIVPTVAAGQVMRELAKSRDPVVVNQPEPIVVYPESPASELPIPLPVE